VLVLNELEFHNVTKRYFCCMHSCAIFGTRCNAHCNKMSADLSWSNMLRCDVGCQPGDQMLTFAAEQATGNNHGWPAVDVGLQSKPFRTMMAGHLVDVGLQSKSCTTWYLVGCWGPSICRWRLLSMEVTEQAMRDIQGA
jgi:hypothetical protein